MSSEHDRHSRTNCFYEKVGTANSTLGRETTAEVVLVPKLKAALKKFNPDVADDAIRLFDSIMADFPIGSFLYWKLEQKNKDEWPVYEFIREFDAESPHNPAANMAGITKDITLVLDG